MERGTTNNDQPLRPRPWKRGKLLLQGLILVLVMWGIWRTAIKAQRDFERQQVAWQQELAAVDLQLASLPVAGDPTLRRNLEQRREVLVRQQIDWKRVDPRWLVLAACFYLAGTAPAWWFWHRSLFALGQRPRRLESLRAYMIGHLGKYVPGKALVVVLRASLVQGVRVETWAAIAAVFVETLTMMAVGAALAAVLLIVSLAGLRQPLWLLGAAGLAVLAGIPTVPALFRKVVRFLMRKRAARNLDGALAGIDGRHMAWGWVAMSIGWGLLGLSLWATVRGLPGDPRPLGASLLDLPLLTACTALAMVLGFVSLIPGGFGVRELVMTSLLAPQPEFGAARALVAAVLLRIVWLLAELALCGVLYSAKTPARHQPENEVSGSAVSPDSHPAENEPRQPTLPT